VLAKAGPHARSASKATVAPFADREACSSAGRLTGKEEQPPDLSSPAFVRTANDMLRGVESSIPPGNTSCERHPTP
jgi:hypothetical protein